MDMSFFEDMEARIPKGEVRTRFAPSPTGYMHVGGLRTALYTFLLARRRGGKFILRIEDTDQERFVEGATEVIYRTLRDSGLNYDEGPDVGGPVGPYIQTERRGLYEKYARLLVEKGGAYYCFCGKERLDELKAVHEATKVPHKYDGHCSRLPQAEIEEKLASGIPYVVRQKIPQEGQTGFNDAVFGEITVDNATLDDNVLLKSDGLPTYNFANVVDDHLMGITHIVRGSEYLSSTPKYNLLYKAFGWDVPEYIHCSPVMKNATQKLSKRNGDPTYEDLLEAGYLREAIINYVALLGWSPRSERELFTLEELCGAFDIEGISKSPAIFDIQKLGWFSGEYIRAMDDAAFAALSLPYIKKTVRGEFDYSAISALLKPRCERLADIPEQVDFFDILPDYDCSLYVHKKMKTTPESSLEALNAIARVLESVEPWVFQPIHDALLELIAEMGVKNGQILWPLRVAVSGKQFTPGGGVELSAILGRDETLTRIRHGIKKLGG